MRVNWFLLVLLLLPQNHVIACCVTCLLAEGISLSLLSSPASHRCLLEVIVFFDMLSELPGRLLSTLLSVRCQPIWRGSILQQESG